VEQVTLANATTDDLYYFVIDGFDGATSGYSLEVICTKE
jgi:hypothetical protein